MKIWLSKNSEVPVREQLVTQITLGIISGDLPVGERIPSTREISRRFQIHANTVGAAYQKLTEQGLIEFKKGSGFYVCESKTENKNGEFELGALASEFFRVAQSRGFSLEEICRHLQKRFENQTIEKVLVVEPDENMRAILIEEIGAATNFEVYGAEFEELADGQKSAEKAVVVAMVDEKSRIESILHADKKRVYLTPRSVANSMKGETRPQEDDLIAVVSGWESFLLLAKTVLTAADVQSDSIILRSTKDANWKKGLQNASMIICDALTAKKLARDRRTRIFHLISDESLNDIKHFAGK
jgi:DNA-binding transcriptional regulator YhcF (GntR family)